METFYLRHSRKLDVNEDTLNFLWESKKIAIHYPHQGKENILGESDNSSIDPNDYFGSARKAMTTFERLGSKGGYILAEYSNRTSCLIGVVLPGTTIEIIKGKWGDPRREALLKTLQLSKYQEIPPEISVKLLFARPRMGTVMSWHSAQDMVENRIKESNRPPALSDLHPTFQEVLCAEFLRLSTKVTGLPQLAHLILPVGRTLRDLDIYGIDSSGDTIAAQVTFQSSGDCPDKVEALRKFNGQNVRRVFFCNDSSSEVRDGIHYYRLEDVFSTFTATPTGKLWLSEVLR